MGNRLSRIYTRTGDDGTTGLGDGSRVAKDSARVEAYGTLDEANSAIGLILAGEVPDDVRAVLVAVQHQLFDLGGELCIPGHAAIHAADIDRLEQHLDTFNEALPALKEFILPGGGEAGARCHVARTVVRRAERQAGGVGVQAQRFRGSGGRVGRRVQALRRSWFHNTSPWPLARASTRESTNSRSDRRLR